MRGGAANGLTHVDPLGPPSSGRSENLDLEILKAGTPSAPGVVVAEEVGSESNLELLDKLRVRELRAVQQEGRNSSVMHVIIMIVQVRVCQCSSGARGHPLPFLTKSIPYLAVVVDYRLRRHAGDRERFRPLLYVAPSVLLDNSE